MNISLKKFLYSILIAFVISTSLISNVYSKNEIIVYYNNTQMYFDVPPTSINGRTLVPVRAIFEKLGATVEWNQTTKTVIAIRGETTIELQLDSIYALVNGKTVELDVPLKMINGRTLIPIRFVSENLGAKVDWDNNSKNVTITYNPSDISTVPEDKIRNGKDKYTWKNGTSYDGEWSDNKVNGKGVLTYANGDKYDGNFVNSEKSGTGTYTWANGETYSGSWVNDKMNGYGIYIFTNGDNYYGNWDAGFMNGNGTYFFKDGKILTGIWLDNQYSSED